MADACARLEGYVQRVSATFALAVLETLDGDVIDVPCAAILQVRTPHFQEPLDARALAAPQRAGRKPDVMDGQLDLFDEVYSSGTLPI